MDEKEKAFIYGSIMKRVEEEKKHMPRLRPKRGGAR
jgi:hypothetical protein